MRSTARVILAAVVTAMLMSSAALCAPKWNKAPLNPEYLKYLEGQKDNKSKSESFTVTVGGKQYTTGLIPNPTDLSHLTVPVTSGQRSLLSSGGGLPPYFDLRAEGRVTAVRDQGECGSCWAHAAMASFESCLLPWETWDLSENHLKNATTCCAGGFAEFAQGYLTGRGGAVSEADDPYNPYSCVVTPNAPVSRHIGQIFDLPSRWGTDLLSNDYLKEVIMKYGGVYANIYTGGYYDSSTHGFYAPWYNHNHVICIVGWDDYFDFSTFSDYCRPPGKGAFIARNSWGTGYADGGYFYVSYYDRSLGDDMAVFVPEEKPEYSQAYQYGSGGGGSIGCGSETAWFASIFTATSSAQIGKVALYAGQSNSSYEVRVYLNPTNGPINPSGPAMTQTGSLTYAGFQILRLDQSVQVQAGQRFSVVVKLTTDSYDYPVHLSDTVAAAGQSYISGDGATWSDMAQQQGHNVYLRALTACSGLSVTPTDPTYWCGQPGGPFTCPPVSYTVTNTSGVTANWTASKTQNWLTLAPASGTLAPGQSAIVTASINANANSLPEGRYVDDVTFSIGGCAVQVHHISLRAKVGTLRVHADASPDFGGPVGGPFIPSTRTCYLVNEGGASINWDATTPYHNWLAMSPSSGTLGPGESVNVTLSTNPNTLALPAGSYTSTIEFHNLTNGNGNTTLYGRLGAGPLRVKPGGGYSGNGLSWATAIANIPLAVAIAVPGQEIWVKAGTHTQRFAMKDNVSVYGGFAGTETSRSQRNPAQNVTTISVASTLYAVNMTGVADPATTIDGFTISNSLGKGIYGLLSGGTITNNIITGNAAGGIVLDDGCTVTIANNTITGNSGTRAGVSATRSSVMVTDNLVSGNGMTNGVNAGGMTFNLCTGTVTGNTITGNTTTCNGGGLSWWQSTGLVSNNTISGNTASTAGGVYLCGGDINSSIVGNTITGNTATLGGGIVITSTWSTVANNVIAGNSGGGVYSEDMGDYVLINNTICDNTDGPGVLLQQVGSPRIESNIIAHNPHGVYNDFMDFGGANPVLLNNDVYGNMVDYQGTVPGIGDISADPKFVDRANMDFHLTGLSPCIDAGDNAAPELPQTDIDGQPRVIDTVDIGADEYVTLHVSDTGSDSSTGFSWAQAKKSIQGAVDTAVAPADVWVKAGYYPEWVTLKSGVGLYGGFAGTEIRRSQRNWTTNITTVNGEGADTFAAWGVTDPTTCIDGFTIANWPQSSSAGVYAYGSSLRIANSRITQCGASGIFAEGSSSLEISGNTITGNSCSTGGGGVHIERSSATVIGNAITGNQANEWYGGGGLYCAIGSLTMSGNTVTGNMTTGAGGGIECFATSLNVTDSIVTGNTAAFAGGMYIVNGCEGEVARNNFSNNTAGYGGGVVFSSVWDVTFANNLVSHNTGGGIYGEDQGEPTIINNTISDNTGQGGIYWEAIQSPTVKNNIIAYNDYGIYAGLWDDVRSVLLLSNNNVFGNALGNYAYISPGPGDISKNPFFVKKTLGDYHLRGKSPCIDAGTNIGAPPNDYDGRIRPVDGDGNGTAICDIGAFERKTDLCGALGQTPNGSRIELEAVSVTACFTGADPSGQNWVYVENTDRTAGIRVKTPQSFSGGALVNVSGTIQTDTATGERYIAADAGSPASAGGAQALTPIGMSNKWLGGHATGYEPAIKDGRGPYNIGLLVQSWGRVTYSNSSQRIFYINDGSRLHDGSGYTGVRCVAPAGVNAPVTGVFVFAKGISGASVVGTNYVRTLRVRSQNDITVAGSWSNGPVPLSTGCWNALSVPGIPALPESTSVFVGTPGGPGIQLAGYLQRYEPVNQQWLVEGVCGVSENCLAGDGALLYIPPGGATSYTFSRTPADGDQYIGLPSGSETAANFSLIGHPFNASVPWANCLVTDGSWTGTLPEAVETGYIHKICRWTGSSWQQVTDLSMGSMSARTAYEIYPRYSDLALIVPAQ